MDLDHPAGFPAVDVDDALSDVERTPQQWARARELGRVPVDLGDVDHVLVAGVGGSGISGDVVAALAADRLSIPVLVSRSASVPVYVGPRTLCVAVSRSGDTWETTTAAAAAAARGARLIGVSAGGELAALCAGVGAPWIAIPAHGQPRHALGWLTVPLLAALGLDGDLDETLAVQEELSRRWARTAPTGDNAAKALAQRLADTGSGVVYGTVGLAAVASYRLKCQLNENAKLPSLAGALSECCHNELAAWSEPHPLAEGSGLVVLRDPAGEPERLAKGVGVFCGLLDGRFAWAEQVMAEGESPTARLASLLLFADFVSVYTALALGRDPTPISLIDRLKAATQPPAAADEAPR